METMNGESNMLYNHFAKEWLGLKGKRGKQKIENNEKIYINLLV